MEKFSVSGPEEGRISFRQALAMIIMMGLATTDILVPTVVASLSGRDSWMTVLVSTVWAALIVALAFRLSVRMGERTIIQYARDVLGGWLGGLVALFYVTFFIVQAALVIRNFRTIMLTVFYVQTPNIVFEVVIAAVILTAVRNGLELVSRLNEVLLPLGVAILLFVGVLAARDVELREFLPVLENGFSPVFSGSLRLVVYLAQGALIYLMLHPYIKKGGGLLKTSLAVLFLGPMMLVGVMAIGIFGAPATANMRFVALELVRNINVAGFLQNLDALMMAIWYGGIVAKLCILVYLACLSISQWLGLKTFRTLLLPLMAALVAYSDKMFATPAEMVLFITQVQPGWDLTAELFIPLALLAVAFFKK